MIFDLPYPIYTQRFGYVKFYLSIKTSVSRNNWPFKYSLSQRLHFYHNTKALRIAEDLVYFNSRTLILISSLSMYPDLVLSEYSLDIMQTCFYGECIIINLLE